MADLEEIGLPGFATEQIMIHFGKAVPVPGGVEHELMPEAPSSEPTLPKPEPELEAVELPELELELLDLPEPELEPGPEPELEEPILDLDGGQAVPAAASEEEGVQSLLAAKKLEKYAEAMAEQGYSFVDDLLEADSEELAQLAKDVHMKTPEARRFLKAVTARKSAAVGTGGEAKDGGGLVEAPSCSICFELFGDGTVPRILGCGHSFCEVCLDKMLRPLPACGGRKTLECPKCRWECDVQRGRASELPVNFLGLEG